MSSPERNALEFRPFVFLGKTLLGAEITDSVARRMLSESERDDFRDGLLSVDEVGSLAASRFYESVRRTALQAARAAGPGVVACCGRAIWFVKAADWNCDCDIDVAAFAESSENGNESASGFGALITPLQSSVLERTVPEPSWGAVGLTARSVAPKCRLADSSICWSTTDFESLR